jgi:hypothetical protein
MNLFHHENNNADNHHNYITTSHHHLFTIAPSQTANNHYDARSLKRHHEKS